MNGLGLCAGIGGLEHGVKLACPDYRTVCYVEGEAYAAANLVALMERGWLDTAPIWSDLRTFDARPWRGVVDIVTAGFPCQPYSVAGKQQHEAAERHLWPEIARIVSECEPAFVFLENVGVRAFVEPWRDLRGLGFNLSRPFACTAAELGAGHLRRRVFVLAYRTGISLRKLEQRESGRLENGVCDEGKAESGQAATDAGSGQLQDEGRRAERREGAEGAIASDTWWASEPAVERVVHGIQNRLDRDRALGNAVVPQQAAFAFRELMRELW